MKISFTTIVTRNKSTANIEHIFVPALQHQELMTSADNFFIEQVGINNYARYWIWDKLEEKEKNGDPYIHPRRIETTLKNLIGDGADEQFDDTKDSEQIEKLILTIPVNYQPHPKHKRCNCCERITPWFVGGTIVAEMLLGSFMGLLQMLYAQGENGLIKMDKETNLGVGITSSTITLLWSLWEIFTGGEIIFLRDSGANMDSNIIKFWDWIRGKNAKKEQARITSSNNTCCNKATIVSSILKSFFMLGVFNMLYKSITSTYTTIISLSNTLAEEVIVSPGVYRALQWTQVGLDHADDPWAYASLCYFGFTVINAMVNAKFSKKIEQPDQQTMQVLTEEEDKQLSEARETRFVRWNERNNPKENNSPSIAINTNSNIELNSTRQPLLFSRSPSLSPINFSSSSESDDMPISPVPLIEKEDKRTYAK